MFDDDGAVRPAMARSIDFLAATSLVIATMVGTGIFVTSGYLARDLGDPWWMLATWLVGGVLALFGATVYGELGAMMPRVGGEYVYLSRAFHPAVGFLSGWVSLWVGFAAPVAATSMACASYVDAVVPLPSVKAVAIALVVATSAVHMASVEWGARAQTASTLLKLVVLVGFVVAAFVVGHGDVRHFAAARTQPSMHAVGASLVFVAFAYSGFNAAGYVAGEVSDPERTLPRALVVGTTIVLVLYLAIQLALVFALSPRELGAAPEVVVDVAARSLFGDGVGKLVAAAIAISLLSSVSALVMAGPRVYAAMAEDGLFFRAFAHRSASGAPATSIAAQGLLSIALVALARFEDLLTYVGFTLTAFSALTAIGAAVLRAREPDAHRPYRARFWPWSLLGYVALSLVIVVFSLVALPTIAFAGAVTLLSGLVLYAVWPRGRRGRPGGVPPSADADA